MSQKTHKRPEDTACGSLGESVIPDLPFNSDADKEAAASLAASRCLAVVRASMARALDRWCRYICCRNSARDGA